MEAEYPAEFNEAFKTSIRERDHHRCAICGKNGTDVHHINYIKADTHPLNCITLCRPCHGMTNSDRDYWRYHLTEVLLARVAYRDFRRLLDNTVPREIPARRIPQGIDKDLYPADYRYKKYVTTVNCERQIRRENLKAFNVMHESLWTNRRQWFRRRNSPYIAFPTPDDTLIVVSYWGTHPLPEGPSERIELLLQWVYDIPDGKQIHRTRGFGGERSVC